MNIQQHNLTNTEEKLLKRRAKMEDKTKLMMPCEVYSRVVGYYRPVQNWNQGKRQEFNERVEFCEKTTLENPKFKAEATTVQESA